MLNNLTIESGILFELKNHNVHFGKCVHTQCNLFNTSDLINKQLRRYSNLILLKRFKLL